MVAPQAEGPAPTDLRMIWPNETSDFTPWLAENLHLLGHAIGVDLKLVQNEAYGYGGYTDILAESAEHGRVVIENQLEPSDHDHFVRLMGYAADHKAGILVWVAPKFWEYHQRLLGWLKESMAGNREIYAVEVSLVPGGDLHPVDADEKASSFRPVFSKLALHNDWPDWPVQTAEEQSEAHHRYRAFFQPIIGELRRSGVTDRVDALARNDQGFPSGLPGISYHIGFWGGIAKPSLDVYLWIATDDKDRNKEIFDALYQRRGEIEAELAGVSWDRRNNQRMCSIYFTESGSIADAEERLVELRDWAPDRLIALKAAFQPRLEEVMRDLGDYYRAIRQQASGDGDEGVTQ